MKKAVTTIFAIFFILTFLLGCSRKKDKFLNKKFHSLTTKYNFLFNGNNLYNLGLNELENNLNENFWELIPVEKFKYLNSEYDDDKETNFTKSEDKATLAIQKHSMNVKGKEKNPIMDQAYFLLGKSRYFDNRFIPSLEAFNYILYKYPKSKLTNLVKIWKEKVNIRLDQNDYAIKNLKEILNQEDLNQFERSMANSFISQSFINEQNMDSALFYLKKTRLEKGLNFRRDFLLAQLFQELSINDTANNIYSELIDLHRKIPRDFYINSYIKRSMISDSIDRSITELKVLAKNIENIDFLDLIYHQTGMLYLKKGALLKKDKRFFKKSDSLAVEYFNKSLRIDSDEGFLIAKNYSELAELNFRNKKYLKAGLYYDSTLAEINIKAKKYRKIKKKRDNLNDLIFYETQTSKLDSIMFLVEMSDFERKEFFNQYVSKLEKRKKEEGVKSNNLGSENFISSGINSENATFYFYNPSVVAYGKTDFNNKWGNRKLQDNWRWSITEKNLQENTINNESYLINRDSLLSATYYISLIPKELQEIDSIKLTRNEGYFKLGAIYRDQFEDYSLSNKFFHRLLDNNPSEELFLPAKYFIYKNFIDLKQLGLANEIKKYIIKKYKDSKYAAILLDPSKSIFNDDASDTYERIYSLYEDQKYLEVISNCDKYINSYNGDKIVPKFELLKALAIARAYGFEKYKKSLQFIKLNYSSTVEGKEAEILLKEVLPLLEDQSFEENKLSDNYKIIYTFNSTLSQSIDSQVADLEEYIKGEDFLDLRVSEDYYNNIITFVVIHGLKSYDGGMGLKERLDNIIRKKSSTSFVISSKNYKTIQIHKNLETFKN